MGKEQIAYNVGIVTVVYFEIEKAGNFMNIFLHCRVLQSMVSD